MNTKRGNITWLSYLIVDIHLHTTRALEIMKHMQEQGYLNTLIATRSAKNIQYGNDYRHVTLIPIRYKPVISSIVFSITALLYLPLHMLVSKPNYVIVSPDISVISTIPCVLLAKLSKTKFVLDIRSTPVDFPGLSGLFRKLVFHVSVLIAKNLFNGFTIITSHMRDEVCTSYRMNPNKVGIWTSGVCPNLFDPKKYAISGNKLKHELNLEGKFIVFYHGYLSDSRGITMAGEAIGLLKQKYPDIVLFLLGSPRYSALDRLLHREGLHENVIIHAPVAYKDVPKFVNFSDICIVPLPDLPIWRFQSPLKLLEYLAMEKTVIVSNIHAHSEVVGTETCGIYLQSVDPPEIAKSIVYAYSNKDKLANWGKSGRAIVQKNYTWQRIAENLESYLRSIN